MKLRFSVITCTRNSLPFLEESIASVLIQDYPHIETIFVDGGSTDGTLDVIHSLRRPHTLIENVCDGLSSAMNAGIRAATGDVIAHLHADDYYLSPDVLSTVAAQLEDGKHGWLFGRTITDVSGALHPECYAVPRFSYSRLLRRNFIPHPATFVRRALMLRTGGFDPRLRYAMDYDLWLKLACLSRPVQLDEPLAACREHEGSLPTHNRLAAMEEDLMVRLAHAGRRPLENAVHYLRYFIRRQRVLQTGSGRQA
jgi:glycosyltransferase involved in cell wall biosynthesis